MTTRATSETPLLRPETARDQTNELSCCSALIKKVKQILKRVKLYFCRPASPSIPKLDTRDLTVIEPLDDRHHIYLVKDVNGNEYAFKLRRPICSKKCGGLCQRLIGEVFRRFKQETKVLKKIGPSQFVIKTFGKYSLKVPRKNYSRTMRDKPVEGLLMEKANGDLYSWAEKQWKENPKRGPSEKDLQRIFRYIVLGMQYLHQKGYNHGDVKADNFLLFDDGSVRFADFGLAEKSNHIRRRPNSRGTPGYVAPEVGKMGGFKAESYSLGALLFDLAYGKELKTPNGLQEFSQERKKDLRSKDLQDLITKLLQPDPDNRPHCSEILKHHWMQAHLE